jgi:hypothetical protein
MADNDKPFAAVLDHPEDTIHCLRVIEFVGPRKWVDNMLGRSFLRPDSPAPLGDGREAREVGRVLRVIKRHE